ncbi:MAG: twin-arginine translocation pathway signal protein [Rhizobiales bacterium 65-79]|jgi:gluconate 2-dehydrogenase gamma chain|nr:gluconate 2-dehydrogenase subunit 3 family protein [Hyphomicrobiales bacterium]OJU04095.1 MAG: twin-arginine translocation pathway signal protein [Rhizobiales bacterium 65-79]
MSRKSISRRGFLTATLAAGSTAPLVLPALARQYQGSEPWTPDVAMAPERATPAPAKFFSPEERTFIEAAVDRLIPKDEWPSATEAGVAHFLDGQLAGAFGRAESWYMQGPWEKGEDSQGFQSRLAPAPLYRAAIKAIDDHCGEKYGGRKFADLSSSDQDDVLKGLEKGDVKLKGVDAKTFFTMLLQNTIEGFFSDPVHGGNKDMVGWKMIGFPGARYDYRPYISKHNQKLDIEPVSVAGVDSFGAGTPSK